MKWVWNMNKEEIKAIVLAECQRLCPEYTEQYLSKFDLGLIGKFRDRGGDHWTLNTSTGAVLCCIYEHQNDQAFLTAYRFLGLEVRAKDAEIDGLLGMVKREQEIADEYLGRLKVEREKIAWLRAGIGAVLKLRGSAFSFEKTYGFSMLSYLLTGEEYKDQCKRLVEDELENGGQS